MSPGWITRGGDQLRGLLWMGPTKHPAAGDMPLAKDKGMDVASCLNRRFWAPKGTPADRVAYFADVLTKAMETETLKAYHKKRLSAIHIRTGADLAKDIKDEMAGYLAAAPDVKAAMGAK
jgi:tripartite-type tricarboxylate transporter receptor subunit TctC